MRTNHLGFPYMPTVLHDKWFVVEYRGEVYKMKFVDYGFSYSSIRLKKQYTKRSPRWFFFGKMVERKIFKTIADDHHDTGCTLTVSRKESYTEEQVSKYLKELVSFLEEQGKRIVVNKLKMKKDAMNLSDCEQLEVDLNFYAVRSKDGKFLRAKKHTYGSLDTGKSWTDNISEAKIYAKPGPARSQCTWWAKNYPSFGAPDLVLITTAKCFIVNEDERIESRKKKDKLVKLNRSLRNAIYTKEVHAAKVKLMRGDGLDEQSLRLDKLVKNLQNEIEQLKNEK